MNTRYRMSNHFDYDVVVIGSGLGGSAAALRLTEKGYSVGVLEAGRRFEDAEFPKTSWDVRKFFWAPKLGCTGIQRIRLLPDVVILAGAGVGGGSLVYPNALGHKYPRRIWFLDKLPKGPTGKILKRDIAIPAIPVEA